MDFVKKTLGLRQDKNKRGDLEQTSKKIISAEKIEQVAWKNLEGIYDENPKLFHKYNEINGVVRIVFGHHGYSCILFNVENGIVTGFSGYASGHDARNKARSLKVKMNIIKFVSLFAHEYKDVTDSILETERTLIIEEMRSSDKTLGKVRTREEIEKSVKKIQIEDRIFQGARGGGVFFPWEDESDDPPIRYDWIIVFAEDANAPPS